MLVRAFNAQSRQIVVNLGEANLQKAAVIKFNVLLLAGGGSSYLMRVGYKKSREKRVIK